MKDHYIMKILICGFGRVYYIVNTNSFMLNWTEEKDTLEQIRVNMIGAKIFQKFIRFTFTRVQLRIINLYIKQAPLLSIKSFDLE